MQKIQPIWLLFVVPFCAALPGEASTNPPTMGMDFRLGDRPSVCLERASPYISPNLDTMTKIAIALQSEKAVDEVGLIRSADGTSELAMLRERSEVEPSEQLRAVFAPFFDELKPNLFTPWGFFQYKDHVLAQPGDYFPNLFIVNSGPWCGGSDEEWQAEMQKRITSGIWRGGPILYRYHSEGASLEERCTDERFVTEERGKCELPLNDRWAIIFSFTNKRRGAAEAPE